MDYVKIFDDIFSQFEGVRFGVNFWGIETKYYGSGTDALFILRVEHKNVLKRLLAEGALGFGESYMNGTLEIEGDIDAYLRLRHQFRHVQPSYVLILAKIWAELTKPKKREEQISYHYDLGNDFFSYFLDKSTMSYSAGRYVSDSDTLDIAQLNKLQLITDWMHVQNGSRILDLGSGWGGFAMYAAERKACHVFGKTLSKKQLAYCRDLVNQHGFEKLITISHEDFTKVGETDTYDAAVMIEALEHVGKENLEVFLKRIHGVLQKESPFYLQFTGRYQPKSVDAWTLKYVFPGGHLPSKSEFLGAAQGAGFVVEKFEDHTDDYIKTMKAWIEAIENHQDDIVKKFDEKFFRLWKLWTHGALVNFEIGDMSLFRVLLRRK